MYCPGKVATHFRTQAGCVQWDLIITCQSITIIMYHERTTFCLDFLIIGKWNYYSVIYTSSRFLIIRLAMIGSIHVCSCIRSHYLIIELQILGSCLTVFLLSICVPCCPRTVSCIDSIQKLPRNGHRSQKYFDGIGIVMFWTQPCNGLKAICGLLL